MSWKVVGRLQLDELTGNAGLHGEVDLLVWQPIGLRNPREGPSAMLSSEGTHLQARRHPVARDKAHMDWQTEDKAGDDALPLQITKHREMLSTRHRMSLPMADVFLRACL